MGKRKEVAFEEKVSLVEEYLAGRLRMREAARRAGVGHTTMESWISRYRSEGISALEENGNRSKRKYSEDFKRQVAEEYLSGQGSSMAIAEKYHLRSGNLVLDWVKVYHDKDFKRKTGENEIDLIIEENGVLYPVEIKMSGNPKAIMGATNQVLDKIPDKKRGMGIILCLIDKKTYLRENLIALPIEYI